MLIFERSVTAEYAKSIRDYVNRRLRNGRAQHLKKNFVLIPGGEHGITIVAMKRGEPAGWLMLRRRPSWVAYEVKQLWVEPHERGKRLSTKLFRVAINDCNLLVASGITQTKHARALWTRFVQDEEFVIWAHSFSNTKNFADVWFDGEELVSSLEPLYTRDPRALSTMDVRLVARRKYVHRSRA